MNRKVSVVNGPDVSVNGISGTYVESADRMKECGSAEVFMPWEFRDHLHELFNGRENIPCHDPVNGNFEAFIVKISHNGEGSNIAVILSKALSANHPKERKTMNRKQAMIAMLVDGEKIRVPGWHDGEWVAWDDIADGLVKEDGNQTWLSLLTDDDDFEIYKPVMEYQLIGRLADGENFVTKKHYCSYNNVHCDYDLTFVAVCRADWTARERK